MEELYYIQNGWVGNCLILWRVDGKGYTTNLDEAWKVTKEKADEICKNKERNDRPRSVKEMEKYIVKHISMG